MSAIFARIAKIAYEPQHAERIADFALTATFENEGTDTQGIHGILGGDTLVIAFRGTSSLRDILFDLRAARQVIPYDDMRSDSPVRVHGGFSAAYESVREKAVLEAIKSAKQETIIFVGHSLGGALATLAALDAAYWCEQWGLSKKILARTLGSPRVGNFSFKESYERRVPWTVRFVNDADLVPLLPPRELGFTHIGRRKTVGQDDPGLVSEMITDHGIDKYIEVMEAM